VPHELIRFPGVQRIVTFWVELGRCIELTWLFNYFHRGL